MGNYLFGGISDNQDTKQSKQTIYKNLSIIVAIDSNWGIGYKNKLLYKNKDDMKRFKDYTTGKAVIMGNNTWKSLPKRPLPNRQNIVLTRDINKAIGESQESAIYFKDYKDILWDIEKNKEMDFVVIGGEQIYKLFLPYTSKILLTDFFKEDDEADTFFPKLNPHQWNLNIDAFSDNYNFWTYYRIY